MGALLRGVVFPAGVPGASTNMAFGFAGGGRGGRQFGLSRLSRL